MKRPDAAISGTNIAHAAAVKAGAQVRLARKRRRLTQAALALRIGISRARLAEIEVGEGGGAPLEVWFAIAQALGRYLKFEFARDAQADVADAGHLAMQELVIRVAKAAGWDVSVEAASGGWQSNRSIDVRLADRRTRQIVIVECWNTFGDLGAAARSGNSKVRDEEQRAVATGGDGAAFTVGLVWVVCDTSANRRLVSRYPELFAARLPGSSAGWMGVINGRGPMPSAPGLIWCAVNSSRLFARRRTRRR